MSDNRKKAEQKMAKAIFISADCWLAVFDLLEPSQLGLAIALISHRFDFYVDEHFKTRKWVLKYMEIWRKIGTNNAKQMAIFNSDQKSMQIPQKSLPKKVVGFKAITIEYIDNKTIAFLHLFRPLFASSSINLAINTCYSDRTLEFILHNIWPMLGKNIHGIKMPVRAFCLLRHFVPSLFNNCPSIRVISLYAADIFTEFPCDDSAAASDGQALAKWLFTPFQNNVPKVFKCQVLASRIEPFKTEFANASSPVNFIAVIWFFPLSFAASVVPFVQINELTREQLVLKRIDDNDESFLLIRCPIVRDARKWAKWEEEAIDWEIYEKQWNQIDMRFYDEDQIGDGLLDAMIGPSDH
ncbi:hypothetical protein niasHT_029837 [Heterodera trifolii]|uniref:F-box domain-containing protein n=1 Tax=Heterodera trifolii TaxID=157864 RepID=A0ABD2K0Y6_9BILA